MCTADHLCKLKNKDSLQHLSKLNVSIRKMLQNVMKCVEFISVHLFYICFSLQNRENSKSFIQIQNENKYSTCWIKVWEIIRAVLMGQNPSWRVIPAQPSIPGTVAVGTWP